jgi:hypothetical protein
MQSKLLLIGEERIKTIGRGAAMAQYSAPAAPAYKTPITLNLYNPSHASDDNRGWFRAISID